MTLNNEQIISEAKEVYFKEYEVGHVDSIANDICYLLKDFNTILFYGDLGAGKTTLIKSMMKEWKVDEEVTSPTFAIVNEYKTNDGKLIYHMDLYRLNDIEEAIEIGIEDMIDSGNRCVIEWPEQAIPFLSTDYAIVNIEHLDLKSRKISVYLQHDQPL